MTGPEIEISRFKGTAFYDIAVKSNINGGKTLTGVEIQLFENATEGLGVALEDYGLQVSQGDELTAKQARKNVKTEGKELDKLYKAQFGNEGKQAVESSEERALGIIETAKMSFERNHRGIEFTPDEVGNRPMFTEAKYKGKPTKYAADLVGWAKDVAASYDLHDKMSNEDLAALIIKNDNANTRDIMINDNINAAQLSNEMLQLGNQLLQAVEEGKAEIINTVKESENRVVRTIRSAEGHIVNVVQNAAGQIIGVVHAEGAMTRNTVRKEAVVTRMVNRRLARELEHSNDIQHAATRNQVRASAQETQEINQAVSEISARLAAKGASPKSTATIKRLETLIVDSYMPHANKMELLNQLKGLAYTEKGLKNFEIVVDKYVKEFPEPTEEEVPSAYLRRPFHNEMYGEEEPYYEDPFPVQNGTTGSTKIETPPSNAKETSGDNHTENTKENSGYPEDLPTQELRDMYEKAPDYAREKLKNAREAAQSKGQDLTEEAMKSILEG